MDHETTWHAIDRIINLLDVKFVEPHKWDMLHALSDYSVRQFTATNGQSYKLQIHNDGKVFIKVAGNKQKTGDFPELVTAEYEIYSARTVANAVYTRHFFNDLSLHRNKVPLPNTMLLLEWKNDLDYEKCVVNNNVLTVDIIIRDDEVAGFLARYYLTFNNTIPVT